HHDCSREGRFGLHRRRIESLARRASTRCGPSVPVGAGEGRAGISAARGRGRGHTGSHHRRGDWSASRPPGDQHLSQGSRRALRLAGDLPHRRQSDVERTDPRAAGVAASAPLADPGSRRRALLRQREVMRLVGHTLHLLEEFLMSTFNVADIPDMTGKTVIVTGASSGIGLATAHALAGAGARVVFAVRDIEKGRAAATATTGVTEVRELNLASLDSVRAFAADWDGRIDLLINNAGVGGPELARTADGLEMQFGTNHLGHFALTNLLLEHITGRVVTVASQAERLGRIDFDDLNWEHKPYRSSGAYAQSKRANLLFTAELQRRLSAAGSGVLATAAHPGFVATNIYNRAGRPPSGLSAIMIRWLSQGADM